MDCNQAQHLFDAYLDGELSPALATELGAHRVRCSDCRRALALLEVSEHILSLDRDPVSLDENFSERLVACVERGSTPLAQRAGRWVYLGGPIAAAAVIALAFLGVFDGRRETEVAGARVVADFKHVPGETADEGRSGGLTSSDPAPEAMFEEAQSAIQARRRSLESLQAAFDLTLQPALNLLEKAQDAQQEPVETDESAPQPAPATSNGTPKQTDELEDL